MDASLRMEDGIIKWYEGDTFCIDFVLTDSETGEPYVLKEGETVEIGFYWYYRLIKSFVFDSSVGSSTLTCVFDLNTSKLFSAGKYAYCIRLNGSDARQTILANQSVEVEKCH